MHQCAHAPFPTVTSVSTFPAILPSGKIPASSVKKIEVKVEEVEGGGGDSRILCSTILLFSSGAKGGSELLPLYLLTFQGSG